MLLNFDIIRGGGGNATRTIPKNGRSKELHGAQRWNVLLSFLNLGDYKILKILSNRICEFLFK